jgi:hypothetical protein
MIELQLHMTEVFPRARLLTGDVRRARVNEQCWHGNEDAPRHSIVRFKLEP